MAPSAGSKSTASRRALGRGLAALLPSPTPAPVASPVVAATPSPFRSLPIEKIRPGRGQPRKAFDEVALAELADSIRVQGVLQPIVVRKQADGYEIVAGERRWRAAGKAGLREVPALIKELTDVKAMQVALIENIQRQDLDPLEEAMAYQRLIEEHSLRHEDLAKAVGKNRTAITHSLRLLRLPDSVLAHVASGKMSPGHARALMALKKNAQREQVAEEIVKRRLSVREVETRVKELDKALLRQVAQASAAKRSSPGGGEGAGARSVVERLQRALGLKVRLVPDAKRGGKLEIYYDDHEQLGGVLDQLL